MGDEESGVEDLERILSDLNAEPIKIPYAVIKLITKNFAQVIGDGGFGVVYLGDLGRGMVAVKKLFISESFTDKQFLDEVACLKRVKHKNIVKYIGYCADTQGYLMEVDGEERIVEVPQRLLCFEYVPNGSLHHYLQDFGLSRCIDENQSTIFTTNLRGTPGYIAPEFIDKQKISFKSDIFSLGIIMTRLLIGSNESIAENWHESLHVECQQMKICIEIAQICAAYDPSKRPTIADIILKLNKTETMVHKVLPDVNEPRNDPKSSLHQVVKRFRALPTQTLHEYSRFTKMYEDLNVLERILEGSEEPSILSYPLLQSITGNFSTERRIGRNELGEHFKGIFRIVVVTRLPQSVSINDGMFHRQIGKMMMAQHQNIIRFLGYCSYATEEKNVVIDGKVITAEKRERLLCFEHLSKGNLSKHLSDELSGLEWHMRYQIIKGICEGLCYLHKEKDIIHMDLKPASILLDVHMVPKITGFGIPELIIMSNQRLPRLGYSAPESMFEGVASRKADIYSVGIIIIELVTGSKKKPSITNSRCIPSAGTSTMGTKVERIIKMYAIGTPSG
ncbi:uncharacterized protein [Setaria viridis]|uniref:uncharacterized protein isoform X2 n=1 Tax=Setaria viridis TaxID=4556 RepID=UPI003B3AF96F